MLHSKQACQPEDMLSPTVGHGEQTTRKAGCGGMPAWVIYLPAP